MFDFPAPTSRSTTRRWTALASAGIHALVIVAVVDHKPAPPVPATSVPVHTNIWVPPRRTTHPPDEQVSQSRGLTISRSQMVDFPDAVPDELPPPDLSGAPIDPCSLTGTVAVGDIGSLLTGIQDEGAPFNSRQVDQPPRLLQTGPLEYPSALEGTGIEGWVRLQFIVDTTGKAIPSSLRVLAASHDLFIESAKRTVLESRFEPGRQQGQAVPVLVEQVVRYK